MKNLLNNPKVVAALGIGALVLVFDALVVPLLESVSEVVLEPVEDPLVDDPDDLILADTEPTVSRVSGPSVASGGLTWNDESRRDPFSNVQNSIISHVASDQQFTLPRLDALVAGPESSLALLNGKVVSVGMTLGGFTVIAIDRAGVTLRSGRGEHRLKYPFGQHSQLAVFNQLSQMKVEE